MHVRQQEPQAIPAIEVLPVHVGQAQEKRKRKNPEETKYLDPTEMVKQPGKRPRQDDQCNLNW